MPSRTPAPKVYLGETAEGTLKFLENLTVDCSLRLHGSDTSGSDKSEEPENYFMEKLGIGAILSLGLTECYIERGYGRVSHFIIGEFLYLWLCLNHLRL